MRSEEEIPEVPLVLGTNKGMAFLTLLGWLLLAAGVGYLIYLGSQKYVFKYSFYKYKSIVQIACYIVAGLIASRGVAWFMRVTSTVFTFTDRHIREERSLPWPSVESCDLTDVKDKRIEFLGTWTLIVLTKDVSTPEIKIKYLSKEDAEAGLRFLEHYASSNYIEYAQRREKENK